MQIIQKSYSRVGVDRTAVDVKVFFRKHLGALVDGTTRTVKDTAQHVFGHTKLQALSGELYPCLLQRQLSSYLPRFELFS